MEKTFFQKHFNEYITYMPTFFHNTYDGVIVIFKEYELDEAISNSG